MKHIPIFFSILFLSGLITLYAAPLPFSNSDTFIKAGTYIEILEDPNGTLTIDDILTENHAYSFVRSKKDVPYLNFTDSAIWVRLTVEYTGDKDTDVYIELAYPLMDHIEYYELRDSDYRKIITGYMHPFSTREVKNNNFIFSLNLSPENNTICYFRFTNKDRMEIPLTIWDKKAFHTNVRNSQFAMGLYTGIILLLILINMIMFVALRDRTFLYHTFFIVAYFLFQFTQTGYTFEYLTPHGFFFLNHHIPFNIGLLLISVALFVSSYLDLKIRKHRQYFISRLLCCIIAAALPLQFIVPYWISVYIQLVLSLITLLFISVCLVHSILQKYKPAYFFAAGLSAMIAGGAAYALKVADVLPGIFIVNYGLQIGSIVHFSLVTVVLGLKINIVYNKRLQAEHKAAISEERYKALVEGTDEFIFTLSENWIFLTANKASKKHLLTDPNDLIGTSLIDLIYEDDPEGEATTTRFVKEKLDHFVKDRRPISFHLNLKTKDLLEPKNVDINLQFIDIAGKTEILGKAQAVIEDTLLKYFYSEKQTYKMGNYMLTANDITQRVTRNLQRYIPKKEINIIRIALREMIINAIEHGNLGITYEEKTREKISGNYFEFLAERRSAPEYASKIVIVEFAIDEKKAVYTITDEGKGFDYQKFLNDNSLEANTQGHAHGRGISMTKNIFDSIEYNETGNSVTLTKFYK